METPVKAGPLYVQHFRFGKKCWRKVGAQLFATSPCGIARLETSDARDDGSVPEKASLRKSERRVIRLADCVSVGLADAPSCPKDTAAFCLNTVEKSYVLAAERRDEWVCQLCQLAFQCTKEPAPGSAWEPPGSDLHVQENALYSSWQDLSEFQVLVHRTDASARCGLSGRYLLAALPEGLVLKAPESRQLLLAWPYHFLRKFGHDKATFSFEAGRRCDSGEGVFTMGTGRAPELCSLVSAAIARQSGSRAQAPEAPRSTPGTGPQLRSALSLEEAPPPWALERPALPAGHCPERGQALPCALEPGGHAGAGAEPPLVYASIRRGLQPPLLMPWGEAEDEPRGEGASWGERPPVSEHLYENLCALEGEGPSGLDSRGSPEGSSIASAPIYDNSCMVAKRWSSPSLEAQYRRLLELDGQGGGEEEGEGQALVSALPKGRASSGLKKLVTLLSREAAPKAPGTSPSGLDRA
ncbi:docking protein 3 [Pelodiscus sinensis]|uniref:docking protein 3 n=1 Tax=Pelodiscus sinensis TaxID=13735 RepID=UPI003F6C7B2C